jgi:GTP1/Obg family GTP-binding protein
MGDPRAAREGWSEEDFAARGEKLTEATFRKYVQLGLLPRSVRVARKGKRRGSQGLYPAGVVRQIDEIRRLMGQGYTMEEIQRELLFVRGDIEELARQLERIYGAIEGVLAKRRRDAVDELSAKQLEEAKELGRELLGRLEGIDKRMSLRARMARAAV